MLSADEIQMLAIQGKRIIHVHAVYFQITIFVLSTFSISFSNLPMACPGGKGAVINYWGGGRAGKISQRRAQKY